MSDSQWDNTFDELREALVSGMNPQGVELEAEQTTSFGATSLVTIVEASSGDTETQVQAYADICARLNTKLTEGANQVLGCIVIDGTPDPEAMLTGLDEMLRADGTFTPVLPLSADQAQAMVSSGIALFDVVDPATALLEVAASRSPITTEVATTALDEIDEVVARHTAEG